MALDPHLRSAAYGASQADAAARPDRRGRAVVDRLPGARDRSPERGRRIQVHAHGTAGRGGDDRPTAAATCASTGRPGLRPDAGRARTGGRHVAAFRRVPSGEHHGRGHRRRRTDRPLHRGRDRRSGRHAQRRVRSIAGRPGSCSTPRTRWRRCPASPRRCGATTTTTASPTCTCAATAPISSGVRRRRANGRTSPRPPTLTAAAARRSTAPLFDADHDGDLDLLLIKRDGGDELLNNNGDGTFRSLGSKIGLTDARPSTGIVVADLDADRDADIILIKKAAPHIALVNDRTWQYHRDLAIRDVRRRADRRRRRRRSRRGWSRGDLHQRPRRHRPMGARIVRRVGIVGRCRDGRPRRFGAARPGGCRR